MKRVLDNWENLVVVFISMFIATTIHAQKIEWVRSINISLDEMFGNSMTIDEDKNLIITGLFTGTVDFNPGDDKFELTAIGDFDAFILKLDSNGNFLWSRRLGGTNDDWVSSVTVDKYDNIYLTGVYIGEEFFDQENQLLIYTSGEYSNIFIVKYTPMGDMAWFKNIGGHSYDLALSVVTDRSSNVYITGGFIGTVDFDPGEKQVLRSSEQFTNSDVFLLKLDSNGLFKWVKTFGESGIDIGVSLALDEQDNIYIAYIKNEYSVFLSKISNANSSDNFLWEKKTVYYIPPPELRLPITLDKDGNIYITYRFYGREDFDPGKFHLSAGSNCDIVVEKIDNSGNFLWAKSMGGKGYDAGEAIVVDEPGNIYTTGYFQKTARFGLNKDSPVLESCNKSSDVFIQKQNSRGDLIWVKGFGGGFSDKGYSITIDNSGSIYLMGYYHGEIDLNNGNISIKANEQYSSDYDLFILKMNCDTL